MNPQMFFLWTYFVLGVIGLLATISKVGALTGKEARTSAFASVIVMGLLATFFAVLLNVVPK